MTEIKTEPNIGRRMIAGIIDYLIIYIFVFVFFHSFGVLNKNGAYSISGLQTFIPIIFWGIMTIGLEQWFGATLRNLLVGLKPLSIRKSSDNSSYIITDRKLTFLQSLKRHLLDPIDMFFYGLVGVMTINNSDKNQRLGDIWGKTIVVKKSELK